ncbi:hypothetical protein CVU37_09580 [candidate division BRC1 bacterium HGW-BRC1-1]|nr:MAG: hypothetical protein CVU37_09580 [candidate division BRC1 bacterium HGW-BRC1-1]
MGRVGIRGFGGIWSATWACALWVCACLTLAGCNPGQREEAREQVRQSREWTPENIKKYPKEFALFVVRESEAAVGQYEAERLRIVQETARVKQMGDESRAKAEAGRSALTELKNLYRTADANSSWPVVWRDVPRDADWMRRNIVKLNAETKRAEEATSRTEAVLKKRAIQLEENRVATDKAYDVVEQMKLAQTEIETKGLTAQLEKRLAEIGAVVKELGGGTQASDLDNLDDLVVEKRAASDDASFESLMAQP